MSKFNKFIYIVTIAMLLTMGSTIFVASANSALMEWDGEDNFALLAVDNDYLSVDSEVLTFKFLPESDENLTDVYYETPICEITAEYAIRNSGAEQTVLLGFPMISGYEMSMSATDFAVTVGGNAVTTNSYYGGNNLDNFDDKTFEDVLNEVYLTRPDFGDKVITSYTFDLTSIDACFLVQITVPSDSYILTENVGSYSWNDDVSAYTATYGCWDSLDEMKLYVIGSPFTILDSWTQANMADDAARTAISYAPLLTTNSSSLNTFIEDNASDETAAMLASIRIDEQMTQNNHLKGDMEYIFNTSYFEERLVLLSYEAVFPANSVTTMTVSYKVGAGARLNYEPPKYPIKYVSNPSKQWSSFGDLTVIVYPDESMPFVIDSSIPLAIQEDGSYSVTLSELPEDNITFSVSASENPDKQTYFFRNIKYILTYTWYIWLILIIIIAVVVVMIVRRKKREKSIGA